jgi:hypothetical protein
MMRRATTVAIAMLFAGPAAIGAVQPQNKSEPAHKTVLLTGCLERTSPDSAFTLTNATTLSRTTPEQAAPSPAGTTGTKGTKGTPEIEYELRPVSSVGESGVDAKELGRHIGQRVEITARPIEEAPAAAPGPEVSPAEQPKPPDPAAARIRLTVTTLKSLGTPCS